MKNRHKTKTYEYIGKNSKAIVAVGKLVTLVIAGAAILSSCVSMKTHQLADDEIARLRVDSTFLQYQIAELAFKRSSEVVAKERRIDSLMSVVSMQENYLNEKNRFINDLQKSSWTTDTKMGELVVELENDIHFQTGSSELTNQGEKVLESVSSAIRNVEDTVAIWVVGHTDNEPYQANLTDNWDLSADRALSVVKELVDNEVDPMFITAAARSKYDPQLPNSTEENKSENRRTEIILVAEDSTYELLEDLLK